MIQAGQIITIGTAKFIIDDIRDGHRVGDVVLRYVLRDGFIKLNGATVLREDYPRLVQWVDDNNLWTDDETALGLFGIGDGLTTMRLPDFRDRFIEGVDSNGGAVVEAGVPNITGDVTIGNTVLAGAKDAFSAECYQSYATAVGTTTNNWWGLFLDASKSNSLYGNSDTVQPKSIRLIAQIKY